MRRRRGVVMHTSSGRVVYAEDPSSFQGGKFTDIKSHLMN
jgi:hypothetical protein